MGLPKRELRSLHLFAGAGGGILADVILGHRPVCAVEYAAYPRKVLLARQADGSLPRFPIWDDVRTFDGTQWCGSVDVVCGGFPCQDISTAGKGAGLDGARSGLWGEMARIVREVRPRFVFVENSPALTYRGLGVVLGDLAEMGFDAEWCVLGARDVGAPHQRDRIWILARELPDAMPSGLARGLLGTGAKRKISAEKAPLPDAGRWPLAAADIPKPYGLRSLDGVAFGVDRIEAIGNGQVPQCAASAFEILRARLAGELRV